MPLTNFQREVLAVIVSNRSEASHFAGGLVLNAGDDSPRFSKDFDFFHDAVEELAAASERDAAALRVSRPMPSTWTCFRSASGGLDAFNH